MIKVYGFYSGIKNNENELIWHEIHGIDHTHEGFIENLPIYDDKWNLVPVIKNIKQLPVCNHELEENNDKFYVQICKKCKCLFSNTDLRMIKTARTS